MPSHSRNLRDTLRDLEDDPPGISQAAFEAPLTTRASDLDWVGECKYIERVTTLKGNVPEMNHDKGIFVRYCKMQRDRAGREARFDVQEYIQHCLDDLEDMS